MSEMPTGRTAQFRAMVTLARRDSSYLPRVLAASVVPFVVLVALGIVWDHPIIFSILAVLTALLGFTFVTGRAANAGAFAQIEGQPGAAYAVLQALRGDWRVTPAIAVTRNQDLVHRVVGRPGVVLVAEGSGHRARELLNNELRKTRRIVGDTPLYDVVIGEGEGQVPLRRLQMHMMKLPRNLKPRDVNAVDARLKAVASSALPIPKGPLPKNARMPRGKIG